jgi:hypothetical protein
MKPISAELRRDIEQDKKAMDEARVRALPAIPPASAEDQSNPNYLAKLFMMLANQYRQKQTITWGKMGRYMREETGLRWNENKYFALQNAVYNLSRIVADRCGHLISVAVVNSGHMETKKFYAQADELKLLNRFADTPERKRFWLSEWEWWVANIDNVYPTDSNEDTGNGADELN